MDLYRSNSTGASLFIVGAGHTAATLQQQVQKRFFSDSAVPGAVVTAVMDSQRWIQGLSTISCGSDDTDECAVRAMRAPNPDVKGMYPPQFFAATSVFADRSLAVQNPSLDEIRRIVGAVQRPLQPTSLTEACQSEVYVIIDSLGCAVEENAVSIRSSAMAIPSDVPTRALYHAQILSYWNGAGLADSATATACRQASDVWLQRVFRELDGAMLGFSYSYRNYPSFFLPDALNRWYGDQLGAVQALVKEVDVMDVFEPLKVFH